MSLDPAVAAVRRAVRAVVGPLEPGSRVVVACSGGADSLALLSATVFEAREPGVSVVGATVDHGLQDGSAELAQRVVDQMARLGADETVAIRVRVDAGRAGPEAAAREARYAVLEEVAARFEASLVLLGHTRDDQAETVLLGLARGSGGRSIAGMRPAYGPFVRPLLEVGRLETEAACRAEGIEWWEDPHNADPSLTRSRVRHRVLPVLEAELGPGVTAALARTATMLREDMELLDDQADALLARAASPNGLDVSILAGSHPALRRRVIRAAAVSAGAPPAELFREHVLAVDALVTDWHGQRWIDLPGHLRALRADGHLVFRRTTHT